MKKEVIVILGPTASGKTELAVKLATLFNGEIISADSRQVYRGMDIGTGKDLKKYGKVPYHLIDIISPKKQFTVADFQKRAYAAIEDILARGKMPILCGGTGLYIDAVTQGYHFEEIRNPKFPGLDRGEMRAGEIRKRLNQKSLKQLLALLKKIDPKTYTIIDKKNRRRVQRAMEIYYQTGRPKSQFLKKKPPYEFLKIGREIGRKGDREDRIEKRLDERFKQGMVEEVKRLHKQGVSWQRMEELGLEYKWGSRYARGEISHQEMKENLLHDIKKFAKRQITWFKRDKDIQWVKNLAQLRKIIKDFLSTSSP